MKKLLLVIIFLLTGCAAPVKIEPQNATFSEKHSDSEALERVKTYLKRSLIDPNSLMLECTMSGKGWAREYQSEKPEFGYLALCKVNAKNKFGGYTGTKPYIFVLNGENIIGFEFNPQSWARGVLYDAIK